MFGIPSRCLRPPKSSLWRHPEQLAPREPSTRGQHDDRSADSRSDGAGHARPVHPNARHSCHRAPSPLTRDPDHNSTMRNTAWALPRWPTPTPRSARSKTQRHSSARIVSRPRPSRPPRQPDAWPHRTRGRRADAGAGTTLLPWVPGALCRFGGSVTCRALFAPRCGAQRILLNEDRPGREDGHDFRRRGRPDLPSGPVLVDSVEPYRGGDQECA
jgi:hypothetical protein